MATRFCLISISLLIFCIACIPADAQESSMAFEHLDWLPAGSYIGFLHLDRTQIDEEDMPLLKYIIEDLDIIQLAGDNFEFDSMTVAMVESLDAMRRRQQANPDRKLRTSELWFFDEIVVAHYFDSGSIIRKGLQRETLEKVDTIQKLSLYQQQTKDQEKPIWLAASSTGLLVHSNSRNHCISSIRSGLQIGESVVSDPEYSDLRRLIPDAPVWFLMPLHATIRKDIDYKINEGISEEDLETLQDSMAAEPVWDLMTMYIDGDEVIIEAEAIFLDEQGAESYAKDQPGWAVDLLPFDQQYLTREHSAVDGNSLIYAYRYDRKALLESIQKR